MVLIPFLVGKGFGDIQYSMGFILDLQDISNIKQIYILQLNTNHIKYSFKMYYMYQALPKAFRTSHMAAFKKSSLA